MRKFTSAQLDEALGVLTGTLAFDETSLRDIPINENTFHQEYHVVDNLLHHKKLVGRVIAYEEEKWIEVCSSAAEEAIQNGMLLLNGTLQPFVKRNFLRHLNEPRMKKKYVMHRREAVDAFWESDASQWIRHSRTPTIVLAGNDTSQQAMTVGNHHTSVQQQEAMRPRLNIPIPPTGTWVASCGMVNQGTVIQGSTVNQGTHYHYAAAPPEPTQGLTNEDLMDKLESIERNTENIVETNRKARRPSSTVQSPLSPPIGFVPYNASPDRLSFASGAIDAKSHQNNVGEGELVVLKSDFLQNKLDQLQPKSGSPQYKKWETTKKWMNPEEGGKVPYVYPAAFKVESEAEVVSALSKLLQSPGSGPRVAVWDGDSDCCFYIEQYDTGDDELDEQLQDEAVDLNCSLGALYPSTFLFVVTKEDCEFEIQLSCVEAMHSVRATAGVLRFVGNLPGVKTIGINGSGNEHPESWHVALEPAKAFLGDCGSHCSVTFNCVSFSPKLSEVLWASRCPLFFKNCKWDDDGDNLSTSRAEFKGEKGYIKVVFCERTLYLECAYDAMRNHEEHKATLLFLGLKNLQLDKKNFTALIKICKKAGSLNWVIIEEEPDSPEKKANAIMISDVEVSEDGKKKSSGALLAACRKAWKEGQDEAQVPKESKLSGHEPLVPTSPLSGTAHASAVDRPKTGDKPHSPCISLCTNAAAAVASETEQFHKPMTQDESVLALDEKPMSVPSKDPFNTVVHGDPRANPTAKRHVHDTADTGVQNPESTSSEQPPGSKPDCAFGMKSATKPESQTKLTGKKTNQDESVAGKTAKGRTSKENAPNMSDRSSDNSANTKSKTTKKKTDTSYAESRSRRMTTRSIAQDEATPARRVTRSQSSGKVVN